MVFVKVHWAGKVALGAITAIDGFELTLDRLRWDEPGHAEQVGTLLAFVVAETLIALASAHYYCRIAVAAFCHDGGSFCPGSFTRNARVKWAGTMPNGLRTIGDSVRPKNAL